MFSYFRKKEEEELEDLLQTKNRKLEEDNDFVNGSNHKTIDMVLWF